MKYNYILLVLILLSSCVSQKKYAELEATNQKNLNLLNSATVKLNSCLDEKEDLCGSNSPLSSVE